MVLRIDIFLSLSISDFLSPTILHTQRARDEDIWHGGWILFMILSIPTRHSIWLALICAIDGPEGGTGLKEPHELMGGDGGGC